MENLITREANLEEEEEEEEEILASTSTSATITRPDEVSLGTMSRKEKRKTLKKLKRKQIRKEIAVKEKTEEEARLNNPEELRRLEMLEKEEEERRQRELKEFEERERVWIEAMERKKKEEEEEEERRRKAVEDLQREQVLKDDEGNEDDDWEYVEEGPAEIIWQGNEIIVKKKKVRVPKKNLDNVKEDANRPTSNPLPPQSEAFNNYITASAVSALENVAQQVPNFGTEQDKAHCPFHLKTGACRFGQRCSRVHFYPDKSCTLLIKNMYIGPGLAWEQDEGLEVCECCPCLILNISQDSLRWRSMIFRWIRGDIRNPYTDEEVERYFEEFYEDVHTEFLKFGEIVNFKVCKNGSPHLRGNVYVHYKSLDSAVLAYHSINGRYYAGKLLKCEFVNVTRWKVAICGEYMKSRLKTCSRGTVCNFIHCFRNPGGDYEWADWEKPPPQYWVRKMAALFGHSKDPSGERLAERDMSQRSSSSKRTCVTERCCSRRSGSREMDSSFDGGSHKCHGARFDTYESTHWHRQARGDKKRDRDYGGDVYERNRELRDNYHSRSSLSDTDSDVEWRGQDKGGHQGRKTRSSRHLKEGLEARNGFLGKRTHENASDGDWWDGHGKRVRHETYSRRSPKCDNIEEHTDDKKDVETGVDQLKRDGAEKRHRNGTRKSSKHQSAYPDEYENHENYDIRFVREHSDRDRERLHSNRRKSVAYVNEASVPDDDDTDKKSTPESILCEDQFRKDEKGKEYQSERISKHRGATEHTGDHLDSKLRSHSVDSIEEQLDEDEYREKYQSSRRKTSKQKNKYPETGYSGRGGKNGTPHTDSCDDQLTGRKRHHSHGKKGSRHRDEVAKLLDIPELVETNRLKTYSSLEFDVGKVNPGRLPCYRHSSRSRSRSCVETNRDSLDERPEGESHYGSIYKYDETRRLDSSKYSSDENNDNDRWEPGSPDQHYF